MEKALLPWIQPDDQFFSPEIIEMIPEMDVVAAFMTPVL